jgi:hypothetical protein
MLSLLVKYLNFAAPCYFDILNFRIDFYREMTYGIVFVTSSNLVAPSKFTSKIKHLAEMSGVFFRLSLVRVEVADWTTNALPLVFVRRSVPSSQPCGTWTATF